MVQPARKTETQEQISVKSDSILLSLRAQQIRETHNLSSIVSKVIAARLSDQNIDLRKFSKPTPIGLKQTRSSEIKGFDEAIQKYLEVKQQGGKILILADIDADGISAAAIEAFICKKLDVPHKVIIPSRLKEGRGPKPQHIDQAREYFGDKLGLVVCVDFGSSNDHFGALNRASYLGIPVVVSDHHIVGDFVLHDAVPEGITIVNPARPDCGWKGNSLSAAGLSALRFMAMFPDHDYMPPIYFLAAIGTESDQCKGLGINRTIRGLGIKAANIMLRNLSKARGYAPGIVALLEQIAFYTDGKPDDIEQQDFRTKICPLINSCGRMDEAEWAIKLLTASEPSRAREFLSTAKSIDNNRKLVLDQCLDDTKKQYRQGNFSQLIAIRGHYNEGVIGIAAQNLSFEQAGVPAIVATEKAYMKDYLIFSCRGALGVPIGLHAMRARDTGQYNIKTMGGHPMAAAGVIHKDDWDRFCAELKHRIETDSKPAFKTSFSDADVEVKPSELTLDSVQGLHKKLSPYGKGWPAPVTAVRGLKVSRTYFLRDKITGENKHLSLSLQSPDGEHEFEAMLFNSKEHPDIKVGDIVDISGAPEIRSRLHRGEKITSVSFKLKKIILINSAY
ncbi:MAG: hypothetical protein R3A13_02080 [Bdellovibrionota bacterium]